MARLEKLDTSSAPIAEARRCMDCGAPADVYVGSQGLCCEHYARRVAQMYRTADRMVWDGRTYRRPTGDEHDKQDLVLATYLKTKGDRMEAGAQKARRIADGLRGAPSYLPSEGEEA